MPQKEARTVAELIELLNQIEDKTQPIHVWDQYGYYGTNLIVRVLFTQEGLPLIIETK